MGCVSSSFPSITNNLYQAPAPESLVVIQENGPAAMGLDQPSGSIENPTPVDCNRFAGILTAADYNTNLSTVPGFTCTLGQLSINARIKGHEIRAQHGLTTQQICCSLIALVNNVLAPIWLKYPGFIINSGFRQASRTGSDHEKGMAADLQWPSGVLKERCEWCSWPQSSVPFWQLIYEKPPSSLYGWMHVSYNGGKRQTTLPAICTWDGSKYTSGIINV
jgi:hypothetical protein